MRLAKTLAWMIAVTAAVVFLLSRGAECRGLCVGTPCANDSNCDTIAGCHCIYEPGDGAGTCR